MLETNKLKLPIYNDPENDIFDLTKHNDANYSIESAYAEVMQFKEDIPKVNSNAEIVDARGGLPTLGENTRFLSDKINTQQNDLQVQKSRIDSFTNLATGSTSGDAELIDARIGVDGIIYSNAGGAIRQQINNLNADINNLYNDGLLVAKKGAWIDETGTIKPSNDWYSLIVPVYKCNINGYLIVRGGIHNYQTLVKSYVFLGEAGQVLESGSTSHNYPSLKIPVGAKKVILNALASFSVPVSSLYKEANNTKDTIDSLLLKNNPMPITKTIIGKKVCKTNNSLGYFLADSTFNTEVFKVTKGKKYYAICAMGTSDIYHPIIMSDLLTETDFMPIYHTNETVTNPCNVNLYFTAPCDGYVYINAWASDNGSILLYDCDLITKTLSTEAKTLATEAKSLAETKTMYMDKTSVTYTLNGAFYFENLEVRKGDIVKIKRISESNSGNQFIWFSDSARTDASIPSQLIDIDSDGTGYVVATQDWLGFTVWGSGDTLKKYTYNIEVYHSSIPNTFAKCMFNNTITNYLNGLFYFNDFEVRKGDIVKIKRISESNSGNQYIWLSDTVRNSGSVPSQNIPIDASGSGYIIASQNWAGFTVWGSGDTLKKYNYNIEVYRVNLASNTGNPERIVYVSASNSSPSDKAMAKYNCDGVNDEIEINKAINDMKWSCGTVVLCQGDYYIDKFNDYMIGGQNRKIAICVYRDVLSGSAIELKNQGGVTLRGVSSGRPQRTILHVRDSAFDGIATTEQPSVISGGTNKTGYAGGWGFNVENLYVSFTKRDRKAIGVNYQWSYWGIMDTCEIAVEGYAENVVPCEGLVGFRGWAGWSDGSVIGANDTYVNGFYVAYQLGGEHVILNRLGTRFNYIAYTFGEYRLEAGSGSQIHNITLIECCDEHSQCLPKFYLAGNADSPNSNARVGVTFIDFIIEAYPLIKGTSMIPAEEVNPGAWCGRIDYTTENNENTQSLSNKFWKDGHGKFFRTTNQAHLQMGNKAERRLYSPNYCQKYWDTDYNKELICTEPSNSTWKDNMGNVIEWYDASVGKWRDGLGNVLQ